MEFGGDTGIDADYAPNGYVCFECGDYIEVGEEVLVDKYMHCKECAKEKEKKEKS